MAWVHVTDPVRSSPLLCRRTTRALLNAWQQMRKALTFWWGRGRVFSQLRGKLARAWARGLWQGQDCASVAHAVFGAASALCVAVWWCGFVCCIVLRV